MIKILLFIWLVFTINYVYGGKEFIPRKYISSRTYKFMKHHRTLVTLRQRRKINNKLNTED